MKLINSNTIQDDIVDFIQSFYIDSLYYDKQLLDFALDGDGDGDSVASTNKIIIKLINNTEIIGCITGVVYTISSKKCIIVNFLCIHKNYRSRGFASILRNELFKQALSYNIDFAIFTNSNQSNNHKSSIIQNNTTNSQVSPGFSTFNNLYNATYYHLPTSLKTIKLGWIIPSSYYKYIGISSSLQPLTSNHVPQVSKLLQSKYNNLGTLAPLFTPSKVSRHLLLDNNVCKSYVLQSNSTCVLDFISFFIIKHIHKNSNGDDVIINTAHLYYYVGDLNKLLDQLLPLLINTLDIDQLICLDIMDNNPMLLSNFGFSPGSGKLTYYSFNPSNAPIIQTFKVIPSQIAIVPI